MSRLFFFIFLARAAVVSGQPLDLPDNVNISLSAAELRSTVCASTTTPPPPPPPPPMPSVTTKPRFVQPMNLGKGEKIEVTFTLNGFRVPPDFRNGDTVGIFWLAPDDPWAGGKWNDTAAALQVLPNGRLKLQTGKGDEKGVYSSTSPVAIPESSTWRLMWTPSGLRVTVESSKGKVLANMTEKRGATVRKRPGPGSRVIFGHGCSEREAAAGTCALTDDPVQTEEDPRLRLCTNCEYSNLRVVVDGREVLTKPGAFHGVTGSQRMQGRRSRMVADLSRAVSGVPDGDVCKNADIDLVAFVTGRVDCSAAAFSPWGLPQPRPAVCYRSFSSLYSALRDALQCGQATKSGGAIVHDRGWSDRCFQDDVMCLDAFVYASGALSEEPPAIGTSHSPIAWDALACKTKQQASWCQDARELAGWARHFDGVSLEDLDDLPPEVFLAHGQSCERGPEFSPGCSVGTTAYFDQLGATLLWLAEHGNGTGTGEWQWRAGGRDARRFIGDRVAAASVAEK